MTRSSLAGLVLAALLLGSPALLAQQPADDNAAPAASETPAKPAPGNDSTRTDAAAGTPAGATRSPSDYRSSERISEDLPVSFPVDI